MAFAAAPGRLRSSPRRWRASAQRSCAHSQPTAGHAPRVLIGRDTRESGNWIETELARGLVSNGATVVSAGVVPTPAVAYLAGTEAFDVGIVISASHNPYEDNGIEVFSGAGVKVTESVEREVERIVADRSWSLDAPPVTIDVDTELAEPLSRASAGRFSRKPRRWWDGPL